MKVTAEKLPESQVQLSVEVEPDTVAKAMDKAYRRLVGKVNVPGFRRGKAPRHIVERMLGQEAIFEEALDDIVPQVYREALQEADVQPIDEPHIDIVQQEPLSLKFVVPVRPEFELPDYRGIRIPRLDVAISEADVSAAIEQIREQNAKWEAVDRPAQVNDQVKADVEGWVGAAPLLYSPAGETLVKSTEAETIMDSKDVKIWVSPENRYPVPGFSEQLIGVKAGDVKEFRLTLPADFPEEKYANRSVEFKVTVHEVEEERLPELNDEFAKSLSAAGNFETLDALRDDVRKRLQEQAEARATAQYEDTVVRTVVDQTNVELPPSLINREVDRLLRRASDRLQMQGMSLDQFLKIVNKSEDDYRAELREDAIRNLRTMFVLDQIADNEGIEAKPEDIDQHIQEMTEGYGDQAERLTELLNTPERREDIAFEVRNRKTIDRLVEIASQPTETAPEGEEAPKTEPEDQAGGETPTSEA